MFPFKTLSISALFSGISFVSLAQVQNSVPLKKDEFEIIINFVDGTSDTTVSEVNDDENSDNVFIFNDCKRVYPSETQGLLVRNNTGMLFKAITKGDAWYFENTIGSKISTYRTSPDLQQQGSLKSLYMRSQADTNVFLKYNRANALKLVADNPEAKKLMKRHFWGKTVQTTTFIAGGALIAAGALFPPLIIIGIVQGASGSCIAYLVNPIIKNDFFRSIKAYNEGSSK